MRAMNCPRTCGFRKLVARRISGSHYNPFNAGEANAPKYSVRDLV